MNKTLFNVVAILVIAVLAFAVYANSLKGEFIWEDNVLIRDNAYLRSWSNIPKIFSRDWGSGAGRNYGFYRPLCTVLSLLNYSIGKLDVRVYHLTNILIHIFVGVALYWLLCTLYDDRFLAFFAGLFFVVHPVHTEAVAYISGRIESLVALFILLAFVFYVKHAEKERFGLYVLALLSYAAAMLTKETSLIFPALILLYHRAFRREIKIDAFLPILGISFIYLVLRLSILKFAQLGIPPFDMVLRRIPGFFVAIGSYIRILLIPVNLHMEYGNKLFGFNDPRAIFGFVLLVSLLIYAFARRKKDSLVFFSVFWFFIALLPASNLYPTTLYMAEHYLYLPSVGFFLILARSILSLRKPLYRPRRSALQTYAVCALLIASYSYLTIRQNEYWREPIGFYERTLRYAPDSPRVHNDLGVEYKKRGDYEEAIKLYKKAIEISSDDKKTRAIAYNNLGNVYRHMGEYERAIYAYKKAINENPELTEAYQCLLWVYKNMEKR